MVHC